MNDLRRLHLDQPHEVAIETFSHCNAPCTRWFELSVMANGVVSLCCQDGEGKYPIGDVRTQTLLEVYNAPAWRERRERMLSRKAVEVCRTCTY